LALGRVLRGSFWLSLGSILANFFGFIYWLLISPMVSPATVGKAATVLAIQSLLLSTLSLGIPTGVMRFLGRGYSHQDSTAIGKYFYSALIFILGLDAAAGLLFLSLGLLAGVIPLDFESVLFTSILIFTGANGWALLLAALFNSTLETEYVTIAQFIMGLSRILIGTRPRYYYSLNAGSIGSEQNFLYLIVLL